MQNPSARTIFLDPSVHITAMEKENGDDYVRRIASFIRNNEQRLSQGLFSRQRDQKPAPNSSSVLGWIGLRPTDQTKKPLIFTEDLHHLFYLLMRFEAIDIEVGSLDVRVQNPSRPTSLPYLTMLALKDRSDVLSISSLRSSISSVSIFSLGGGWFGRPEPASVDAELKYLYSAFTKVPALCIRASGLKMISELENDPPTDSAIPMDAFKNLQTLECHDIDPRTLLGWDRLSEGLRSLTVKRSGVEDISDLFIDSVVDDKARRDGSLTRVARPRLIHCPPSFRSRQSVFNAAQLPHSVPEDTEQVNGEGIHDPITMRLLPHYAWSLLTHLSLSDNSLTFLPSLPAFPSLLSLDLSSNLLVSVPPSLSTLPALKSLNLAHNMVESVLGIYSQIPSIISLNLCANRLESLCGLERLDHLARVDLRDNRVDDVDEIGRLAILQEVKEVWISGNPCTRRAQDWRVVCFDMFAKEGREVILDGAAVGLLERRAMKYSVEDHMHTHGDNGRPLSTAHSPPVVAVGVSQKHSPAGSPLVPTDPQSPQGDTAVKASTTSSDNPSSSPIPAQGELPTIPKFRRRKNKRIVDLDDRDSTDESTPDTFRGHVRHKSDIGVVRSREARRERTYQPATAEMSTLLADSATRPSPPARGTSSMSRASGGLTPSLSMDLAPSMTAPPPESPATISQILGAGAARTLSPTKSTKRRARISASVYEPADATQTFSDPGHKHQFNSGKPSSKEAELFRKRIEALRNEVGDGWLKVLNQTQLAGPEEPAVRGRS